MKPDKLVSYKFVPKEIRKHFYNRDYPKEVDTELFQHVAARAVMDALGFTGIENPEEHDNTVRQARVWFKLGDNVEEVFGFAGISCVEDIRKSVLGKSPIFKSKIY